MSMSVQLSSQELAISISDCSTSPKQKTTWHGWHRYHHHHHSRLGSCGTSDQPYHTWSTHQASLLKMLFSHPCQDKDPTIDSGSPLPNGSPARTWSRTMSSPCSSFGCLMLHQFGTAAKLAVVHQPWAVARHTTWKNHKSHRSGLFVPIAHQKRHEMPKLEKSG